jgi:hypothetical protein
MPSYDDRRHEKEVRMKTGVCIATALFFGILVGVMVDPGWAGTVQEVKEGSKAVAKEIKEGAVETGKAFTNAGKEVKEGSKKTWKEIKKGAKETGKEFKKAYQKGKEAVKKELSGEAQGQSKVKQKKSRE